MSECEVVDEDVIVDEFHEHAALNKSDNDCRTMEELMELHAAREMYARRREDRKTTQNVRRSLTGVF